MALSPSVTLIEQNNSTYSTTTSSTVVAVVGYASFGPINVPTMISSYSEFQQTFGYPTSLGFSNLAVKNAFAQGNQIIFCRVAETTGAYATTQAQKVITNGVSFVPGYAEFSRITDVLPGTGGYVNGSVYDVNITSGDGGSLKTFYLDAPYTGRWAMTDVVSQINNQIGATSGYQELNNASPTITAGTYSLKLTVDSVARFGGTNLDFDVSSSDTITSITNTISSAIANGTRGNTTAIASTQTYTTATVVGLTLGSAYNFQITLDGGSAITINLTGITSTMTYAQLVAVINAYFITNNINAVCSFSTVSTRVGLYFASKTRGATSNCVIGAGTTSGSNYALFTSATSGTIQISNFATISTSNIVGVAGISVYPTANSVLSVGINSYTQKIRFTSSSTGTSSNVLIASGTNSVDFLVSFMGGTGANIARAGQALITITAAINSDSGKIRISSVTSTTAPTVADTTNSTSDGGSNADTLRFVTFWGPDSSPIIGVLGTSAIPILSADIIQFVATQYGSSGDKIQVIKTSSVNPATAATVNNIQIYYDGNLQETFTNVSMTISDSNFFATTLNKTVANGGSAFIDVNYWDNDSSGTITFPNGTYTIGAADASTEIAYTTNPTIGSYNYKPGTDGIPASGDPSLFATVLSTSGPLSNSDYFNFHILVTPDDVEQPVQDAAIALAEYRADFMYVVDPPLGLSYSQIISWHNGGGYGRTSAIVSSYAAIYWPWLKTYDSYWSRYSWCPPSVFIAALYIQVDNNYNPWFAPAGNTRGQISASDVEQTVSFAQREQLYGNFNCVNPIVNFASQGLIVYGQKTGLRSNSATNRVNVRRMIIYIKKLIKAALDGMIFEPNNSDSWGRAADKINSILEPVRQGGGLSQYQVVIDSTTNTANTIAQDMMYGIIKLVPVSTIEIITMTLAIYQSGTTLTTV